MCGHTTRSSVSVSSRELALLCPSTSPLGGFPPKDRVRDEPLFTDGTRRPLHLVKVA